MAKTPFRKLSNPLLILSDRAEDLTGLARVARDIASLASTLPEFRVGFLGRGAVGKKSFPWTSYSYPEADGGWGQDYLEEVIRDFFGEERGIVFSNWDLSRLGWLLGPQYINQRQATAFGEGRNFDLWSYVPCDSTGPSGVALGIEQRQIAQGADRILAASEWGASVLKNSGRADADWLPHGLFDKFKIYPDPRPLLGWKSENVFLGVVMTNQARKDWPAAFECIAVLKKEYGVRMGCWIHIDKLIGYWNIYALAADYGVADILQVTTELNDDQLALRYSACDCTILPSGGEGFGYPVCESMACGTACVVTDYAAGQELVPEDCRVRPVTHRVDTQHNCRRAVNSGYAFANIAKEQIEKKRVEPEGRSEELAEMTVHLSWNKLKIPWTRWFLQGLRG